MFTKDELMAIWKCMESATIKGKDAKVMMALFTKIDEILTEMDKKEGK